MTFQITGDPDTAQNRVGPALAATAAVQRAYPHLVIGELGTASTLKAVNTLVSADFHKAEATSVPVMPLILVVAFGALVAAFEVVEGSRASTTRVLPVVIRRCGHETPSRQPRVGAERARLVELHSGNGPHNRRCAYAACGANQKREGK